MCGIFLPLIWDSTVCPNILGHQLFPDPHLCERDVSLTPGTLYKHSLRYTLSVCIITIKFLNIDGHFRMMWYFMNHLRTGEKKNTICKTQL